MQSAPPTVSCIILIVSLCYVHLFGVMVEGRAAWTCTPCLSAEDCDAPTIELCMWGETRNFCGRRVCAKGPGERCGGTRDVLGRCGAGMWCQREGLDSMLETCHGCYDNSLDCHRDIRYK